MQIGVEKNIFKIKKHSILFVCLCLLSSSIYSAGPIRGQDDQFAKKPNDFILYSNDALEKFFDPISIPISKDETLHFTSSLKKKDCEYQQVDSFGLNFTKNISMLNAPLIQSQCVAIDEFNKKKELSPKLCMNLAGCLKIKLGSENAQKQMLKEEAQKNVAAEAIALIAKKGINLMMDFERLRLYSIAKYGESFLPESCIGNETFKMPKASTNPNGLQCRPEIINKGYEIALKNCKVPEVGCFKDYHEYVANKKSTGDLNDLAADFYQQKSQEKHIEVLSKDGSIMQNISLILADDSLSPTERVEAFFDHLKNNYNELDPILKNYYDRSSQNKHENKSDSIRESILSYINLNHHKSSAHIQVDLENLRKSEAKAILKGKCETVMTTGRLCSVVNEVMGGSEVVIEEQDFNKLISNVEDADIRGDSLLRNLAINVSRCNTFILASQATAYLKSVKLSSDYDLYSDFQRVSNINTIASTTESEKKYQNHKIIIRTDGSLEKKEQGVPLTVQTMSDRFEDKSPELILINKFSKNSVLPEIYKNDIETGSRRPAQATPIKKNVSDIAPKIISAVDRISTESDPAHNTTMPVNRGFSPAKNLNSPISENKLPDEYYSNSITTSNIKNNYKNNNSSLMNKISSLEKRLSKMNNTDLGSDKKLVPKDSFGTSPSTGGNSSLIKELRSAKAELEEMKKTQKDQSDSGANITAMGKRERNHSPSGSKVYAQVSVESSPNDSGPMANNFSSSERYKGAGSNNSKPSSAPSVQVADTGTGTKGTRQPITSAQSFAKNIDPIILLTKLDGMGNAAAVNETINKLIYSESGRPFYIEEGGLVKQIVPEIVNGKILINEEGKAVYKKILKGKVGEFKIALEQKEVSETNLESPADLKRAEAKIAPVIRYRELKDLFK